MVGVLARRRALRGLLGATVAVATGFVLAILLSPGQGDQLHEVAASVLLALLLSTLWLGWSPPGLDRRLRSRVAAALVCLLVAALLGGALAVGLAPLSWSGLPLIPLIGMILLAADGLRLTWGPGAPAPAP